MATPPVHFAKYEVLRRLGRGGMGTVYLARDPDLGRFVAIKVLREALLDDEMLQRFLREARAVANLRKHDNLITIYDVGQHDGQPFMAMEYVDGESLDKVIAAHLPPTLAEKLSYIEQICAGLYHAHSAGIVHRDIKPANLMVDGQGVIRILDFGIARIEGSAMTSDGAMMGTLPYMSPEQMAGRNVDYRTDIFAVGAVAYELLCYQRAFNRTLETPNELANDDPVPLAHLCPNIPPELPEIVMRAMARRAEDRFAGLDEMRLAIRQVRRSVDSKLELDIDATRLRVRPQGASDAATPGSSSARVEALERRARQLATHKSAAFAAFARQDIDAALAACEDALTIDPDDREALRLLGELQRAKRDRDQERLESGASPGAFTPTMVRPGDRAAHAGESVAQPDDRHVFFTTTRIATGVAAVAVLAIVGAWLWFGTGPSAPDATADTAPSSVTEAAPRPAPATAPETTAATPSPLVEAGLERGLDQTRAAYERGDLGRALRLIDPVLATANDDRVRQLARSIVQSAIRTMVSAQNAARTQRAQDLSPRTFDSANQLKARAEQALSQNDLVEAGTQALAARSGFQSAEREARAAAVVANRPPAPDPGSAAASASAAPTIAPAPPPQPVPTAPVLPTPTAPSAAPAAAAAISVPSVEDRERPGILRALTRYQQAYRERSVKSLLEVYPTLPREARQGLERAFTRDCRDYDATFGNMQLALNKDDPTYATVTVRTTYTCQPKTAQPAQPQSLQEIFILRKLGEGWLIESTGTMDTNRRR